MSYRILFVIETLFSQDAAQQLELLASSLANRQCEIDVAVLGQKTEEPKRWTDAGINIRFLNANDATPLHTLRDGFQVIRALRRLIQTLSPDIVHTWCGNAELLTLIATQNFPTANRMQRFRLISTELFLQPEKRFTRQSTENWMSERVETMIVPHDSLRRHLVENGYRESRIKIVPNAVADIEPNDDRAKTRSELLRKLDLPESTLLTGAVAPLVHRSRLKDLVWATDLLTCIRPDLHFIIIGRGPQQKQLKRFAALTEAKSHIHFMEHPESPERIIASLDVFWHSHLRDPLSGNLLAAMANGIPAISVLGEGTGEIIHHQETGFAVNLGARDEFARWTKYLIEQTESAKQLARQGQSHVQSHFKASTMIDGYLAIYGDNP